MPQPCNDRTNRNRNIDTNNNIKTDINIACSDIVVDDDNDDDDSGSDSHPVRANVNTSTPWKRKDDEKKNKRDKQRDKNEEEDELHFYSAYCYKSSPTWFSWVKLTAADIHNQLFVRDLYQRQHHHSHQYQYRHHHQQHGPPPQLLFYLNHPIQFVQLVGVIVSFDTHFEKFWIFTVDDGSGATVDVTCRKPAEFVSSSSSSSLLLTRSKPGTASVTTANANTSAGQVLRSGTNTTHSSHRLGESHGFAKRGRDGTRRSEDGQGNHSKGKDKDGEHETEKQSTNENDNDEETEVKKRAAVVCQCDVGTVVQVKGTISLFRGARQIQLERIAVVVDTNHEIALIKSRVTFWESVLSRPWTVSEEEQTRLLQEAKGEVDQGRERTKRRKKREAHRQKKEAQKSKDEERDAEEIQRLYRDEQRKREEAADLARRDGLMVMANRVERAKRQRIEGEKLDLLRRAFRT